MELHKATDNIDHTLDKLIADEPDHGRRANLLVLSAMALNLSANTMALNALSVEIHDHKKDFKDHRLKLKNHKSFVTFMSVVVTIVFIGAVWVIQNYALLSK